MTGYRGARNRVPNICRPRKQQKQSQTFFPRVQWAPLKRATGQEDTPYDRSRRQPSSHKNKNTTKHPASVEPVNAHQCFTLLMVALAIRKQGLPIKAPAQNLHPSNGVAFPNQSNADNSKTQYKEPQASCKSSVTPGRD